MKVVIVGASVSGLSLANMLQAHGIDFVILEAYPDIAPQVGASIGLLPHGNRILHQLGLYDKIMEIAPPVDSFSFRDESGSLLALCGDMNRHFTERHGYPMVFLDRQMLLKVLYANIKDKSRILTQKRVVQVEISDDGVQAITSDKSTIQGDILIGADGIHSTVRSEIWRLAEDMQPGWFDPSEREAPPCDYNCIFGISDPCPGIVPGGLHCVFRDKSSYLVSGGPKGRVYWFRFQKLPQRVRGSKIPRYTQLDLERTMAESLDENILPELKFSALVKNRVTAIMTPLPEYVYKKWHFRRVFTLGDSAHKFHPIGGHGGNAAIETAAALTNELVEALKRSSSERLATAQISTIFANVQTLRRSRALAVKEYSHKRQLVESLDGPLRKFVALRLLPLVDENIVTMSFSAQIPASIKLKTMHLPPRENLIPYEDELLSRPKSRGPYQWALITFYLVCSACVYYCTQMRSFSRGLSDDETAAMSSTVGVTSSSMKQIYTSTSVADGYLAHLPAAFVFGLNLWTQRTRTLQLYFLAQLIQPIAIGTIEGYRDRNKMTLLALPILWLAGCQLFSVGVVMPLYYAVYTATSNPSSYWWPLGRFVPLRYTKVVLAAIFIGYVLPITLMFSPWSNQPHIQNLAGLLQLSSMFVPLLTRLLGAAYNLTNSQRSSKSVDEATSNDLLGLKQTYVVTACCSVLIHWYTLINIATSVNPTLAFGAVFTPEWSPNLESVDERLNGFVLANFWGYCVASYVWSVNAVWDLRRVGRTRVDMVSAALGILAAYLVAGPGAAMAAVWYYREDAMACAIFNVKEKLHRD